ncbi:extracellular solute-binding protein [Paenibacillus sp. FSL H7-0326]|uniref:extracellular solute-binding protein n=2 Tax=Paenibacillus sp. FSL H7-0326 TaxID=1921144 RepID=UPI0026BB551A|nr:extracellular solute-binding protein [Paenibacillus sp. FSL H7-0326]
MNPLMRVQTWLKVILVFAVGSTVMFSASGIGTVAADENASMLQSTEQAPLLSQDLILTKDESYSEYIKKYEQASYPDQSIILDAAKVSSLEGEGSEIVSNAEGASGQSIKTGEDSTLEWTFKVETAGLYYISSTYYPIEGKSSAIERSLLIDGELPFREAAFIQMDRVWDNLKPEIEQDNRGNDLRPQQHETPDWQTTMLKDSNGYYEEPFAFYFSQGTHTLSLIAQREPVIIKELTLHKYEEPAAYEQYAGLKTSEGVDSPAGVLIELQAEDATAKSSPTLYPLMDRSSPATYPYSPKLSKVNTIGGYNWRIPGQWIEWEVEVPKEGLYKLAFNTKQNFVRGIYSTRKLTINGEIPFEEMSRIPFRYENGYEMRIMEDEFKEPYLYHLKAGTNTIRMEVTLGEFAPLIREVEDSLIELNSMYRKILMITGTAPDEVRDYRVDERIPDLLEVFSRESERLKQVGAQLRVLSPGSGDQDALLKTMSLQLDEMVDDPDTIPRRLQAYKTNTGGLGTWLQQIREQPLEIDSIYIASSDQTISNKGSSWFAEMWHEIVTFFYSFFIDYDSIGSVASESEEGRTVTVWIGSGRDQANTIKSMIDETFTPETGIQVNLKLVPMGSLLPATLSGQGPDVAMQMGNDIPVNYAMRNAAADISVFSDYDEVAARFRDSALVPYTYEDGVYALPETQTFNMLFYRKDVLNELGLEVPQTWDEVWSLLSVLDKNHMDFGLPLVVQPSYPGENVPPNSVYSMLLFQTEGEFYRDGGKESDLDSQIGIDAFKQWTEFYTDYKLEREYDFANRFRTGEMPIGIADYTTYNQLTVFAPEIRGMWGFTVIPGTELENGSINRSVASGGSGVLMLEGAEDKEAAWEYMKWWTSEETQVKFGREMEGLMGAAARYPTANINALEKLPWPVEDFDQLQAGFEWVEGIPEVPGGYFTGRHLINAFYRTVDGQIEPREALMDYVQYIQDEIRAKRSEFGLTE